MKKALVLAAFSLLFAKQAAAEVYPYMAFTLLDSTEQYIGADGLKITFSNGNLCATQGTQTITVPLASLSGMHFASSTTGIEQQGAAAPAAKVTASNGRITVACTAASSVAVYNAWGVQLAATTLAAGQERTVASSLPKGVYAVVINGKTQKLCVK